MDLKDLSAADLRVVRGVVNFLKEEKMAGAVSANVALPSGKAVVVFPDGRVVEAS